MPADAPESTYLLARAARQNHTLAMHEYALALQTGAGLEAPDPGAAQQRGRAKEG